MIWFFARHGEQLQCEIRTAAMGTGCELVWTASDGRVHVERSDDYSELVRRRQMFEQWLKRDGWVRLGPATPPGSRGTTSPTGLRSGVDQMIGPRRAPAQRIVVRREQLATFELLQRTFARDSSVRVMWDRRLTERREADRPAPDNRRQHERRSRPPAEWQRLNYVVIDAASDAAR